MFGRNNSTTGICILLLVGVGVYQDSPPSEILVAVGVFLVLRLLLGVILDDWNSGGGR